MLRQEGVDCTEFYSPPRVTIEAAKYGLSPGSPLELLTGWDLGTRKGRSDAWKLLEKEKPTAELNTDDTRGGGETECGRRTYEVHDDSV